ncbi:MAG: radical SAM protein [Anaerolineales bacterium]
MIEEITAKTILNHGKQPDPWFGLKYNMNLYRGCQHQCVYCDSRSDCYRIKDFAKIQVKINALDLLEGVLPRKRVRGTIGFGSMNDPYMPVEREYRLTRKSLEIISANEFPVHILTKSDLVLRDIDLLVEISNVYAAVSFTITTADDELAQKLEPGAPLPSQRFQAMGKLAKAGVLTGVTMMPILPFLEDSEENLLKIISFSKENGATYIIPSFGVSLRPGSREYYYQKLDRHFPGIKEKYIKQYGNQYQCNIPNWQKMNILFQEEINRINISTRIPVHEPKNIIGLSKQMRLFD